MVFFLVKQIYIYIHIYIYTRIYIPLYIYIVLFTDFTLPFSDQRGSSPCTSDPDSAKHYPLSVTSTSFNGLVIPLTPPNISSDVQEVVSPG